jgi:hypothetical protein
VSNAFSILVQSHGIKASRSANDPTQMVLEDDRRRYKNGCC